MKTEEKRSISEAKEVNDDNMGGKTESEEEQ
jgi:hypothetical protein